MASRQGSTQAQQAVNTDYEVRSLDDKMMKHAPTGWFNARFVILGILFGIVFIKAEIVSWYRIQEMFRFQSFHMYGVIGSAVITGMLSVWLIRKFRIRTTTGEHITFQERKFSKGNIYGALLFGFGWALTGACPGPLFAQIGSGALVVTVTLLSALAGTWSYGLFRDRLPH